MQIGYIVLLPTSNYTKALTSPSGVNWNYHLYGSGWHTAPDGNFFLFKRKNDAIAHYKFKRNNAYGVYKCEVDSLTPISAYPSNTTLHIESLQNFWAGKLYGKHDRFWFIRAPEGMYYSHSVRLINKIKADADINNEDDCDREREMMKGYRERRLERIKGHECYPDRSPII